nr:isopeptide-forming domain-containing fimbrial protein [uncultured Blautia sp.]
MKHLKKIAGLLLAVVMMFVMSVTAMADTTYTITIDNTVAGHTYKAYQVFSGKITTETVNGTTESTLSDIDWGSNVNGPDLLIKLKESDTQGGLGSIFGSTVVDAKGVAEALTKANPDANTMKKFAKIVNGYLTGNGTSSNPMTNNSSKILNYQISGLAAGYYLVKDTDPSGNIKLDAYTNYILKVAGDVKVKPKSEVPSSEKKVQDKNDTEKTTTGWIDSADYDIGDDVPFKLTGTVAENYGDFTGVYEFNFVDHQSAGLDEPKNFEAKVVHGNTGTVIKAGYTVSTSKDQNNKFTGDFSVKFPNLKNLEDEDGNIIAVEAGDKIEVTYTSKLNANAIIGSAGNPNTMHLEYSNNPNGNQKGKTKDDTVIVFTYKTVINKTDKDGQPLKGAKFALYKLTKGGDTVVYKDTNGNDVKGTWGDPLDYVEINDADTTTFTFKGLDDGIYKLSETKTPDKFNSIDDIVFEVVATHNETSDAPTLTGLSGNKLSGEISFTPSLSEGALVASVVNYAGSQLPETGGIGTTIFYVVGVVLMLGAGVLLITKRRMSAKH